LTVKVLDEGVRVEDDDYWYVPVQPNVHPAKTSDYYEMLAEIETTLLQEDNLSVTLIPTLPDEQS
jgi:hypothetical protein